MSEDSPLFLRCPGCDSLFPDDLRQHWEANSQCQPTGDVEVNQLTAVRRARAFTSWQTLPQRVLEDNAWDTPEVQALLSYLSIVIIPSDSRPSVPAVQESSSQNILSTQPISQYEYREIEGNVFDCPHTSSLAHCVSADLHMGKGIAVKFRNKFRGEEELWEQNAPVGSFALLEREDRYVYYLVTKENHYDKPKLEDLRSSLAEMANHCEQNGVKELSMPQIGSGLDGLYWPNVARVIKEVFKDTSVKVTVYYMFIHGGPWKPTTERHPVAKQDLHADQYQSGSSRGYSSAPMWYNKHPGSSGRKRRMEQNFYGGPYNQ